MLYDDIKFDKDYGLEMNVSMACNEDGNISIGCHFTDSEGRDISRENNGDNFNGVVSSFFNDILNDVVNYPVNETSDNNDDDDDEEKSLREKIAELEDKIYSLELDNEILSERLHNENKKQFCDRLNTAEIKNALNVIDKIDWRKYL